MSFLTEEEISALHIERFIFHIVQHEDEEPILLDETPIGKFEEFFIGRIKDTLKGNQFEFNPSSDTFRLLKEMELNQAEFLPNSKQIAINFHANNDDRIKPGVIILMQLSAGSQQLFSIVKYDHEKVISYSLKNGTKAILEEITNSFTESKNSLHKSALIKLNKTSGELIIIDRTVSYDITQFFKGFLNIKRKLSLKEMTEKVNDAMIATTKLHKKELPRAITEKTRNVSFQVIQMMEIFDPEEYFNRVYGAYGNDKIRRTFNGQLKKNNIEAEKFKFDKKAIKPPKEKKYRTKEGVKLQYGKEAEHMVDIRHGSNDNPTVITIRTQQLTEE